MNVQRDRSIHNIRIGRYIKEIGKEAKVQNEERIAKLAKTTEKAFNEIFRAEQLSKYRSNTKARQ